MRELMYAPAHEVKMKLVLCPKYNSHVNKDNPDNCPTCKFKIIINNEIECNFDNYYTDFPDETLS